MGGTRDPFTFLMQRARHAFEAGRGAHTRLISALRRARADILSLASERPQPAAVIDAGCRFLT
jgi:hypothetical protein